ncbi:MAG: ATP-binding protein [Nanoarchaeota archaeon]
MKLQYEELKLGEKAKEAFLAGRSSDYIKKECPAYLNTNPVFAGLNVTDLVIAGILSGMNILLVGNTGCGKSQLARDIHNYYFNGNKFEGGESLTIEGHPELDIYRDVLTYVDLKEGKRVLNNAHQSLFWNIEEFNRCPPISQNQWFAVGNGRLIHQGQSVNIGRNGYVTSIATANYGNGEFRGTFEVDKALENRFGLILDLDHSQFQPTKEDRIIMDMLRSAYSGIHEAPKHNLSDKIMHANEKISEMTLDIGLEALAVLNYLKFGLENCPGKDENEMPHSKGKSWPITCQDCPRNSNNDFLCSLINAPVQRTLQSTVRYASALFYLAKLKNEDLEVNAVDLMFKSFELVSTYQNVLNPAILKSEYLDQPQEMMKKVCERLKTDFKTNENFIMTSLDEASKGNKCIDYFEFTDEKGEKMFSLGYSKLDGKIRNRVTPLNPFTNAGPIGLEWVLNFIDTEIKIGNLRKNAK